MRRSYDRREFDGLCVAIFLEAWYQLEESDPPDRQTFISELAVRAIEGAEFKARFAYAGGYASDDGSLLTFMEGMKYAGEDNEFWDEFYDFMTTDDR